MNRDEEIYQEARCKIYNDPAMASAIYDIENLLNKIGEKDMAASSVTGVSSVRVNKGGNEYQTLGVDHLIGPRWNEEKEKEFNGMKKTIKYLYILNIVSNLGFFFMAIAYYLSHSVK